MIIEKPRLTEEQLNIATAISDNFGLGMRASKILVSRGIDDLQKANRFLNAGKHNFLSPFLLSGVSEACQKIKEAVQKCDHILIYGDYDADGICASSIMYYALKELGAKFIEVYIPERELGYGITEKSMQDIFALSPDLLITVDCGIGCKNEIEVLNQNGIEVIVTDHHELPEQLPDCIKVNCKIKSDYPYTNLSGTGVAYKLAVALIGDRADSLLDFVAIATVADSMDLTYENRDLVVEGLKLFKNPRPQLRAMLDYSKAKEITSGLLAFTIAPRINACGRMGNARLALQLMLSDNPSEMKDIAYKLNDYNAIRQLECEKLYNNAKDKLLSEGLLRSVIVLYGEDWQAGLVGIVSARLTEEFNRPTILFTPCAEGFYKGSARSIEGINMFEAISSCSDILTTFGGHSQAAGVSLKKENFEEFKTRLNDFINKNHSDKFVKKTVVEEFITSPVTVTDAKDLLRLEPFGTGNKKPLFALTGHDFKIFKLNGNHISLKTDNLELLYFNGLNSADSLADDKVKTLVFDLNYSLYNNSESVKGFVKNYEITVDGSEQTKNALFNLYLENLTKPSVEVKRVTKQQIDQEINESLKTPYGTVFAVSDIDNLKRYPQISHLTVDIEKSDGTLLNKIIIGYRGGGNYKKVIYLDDGFTPCEGVVCSDIKPYEGYNYTRETLVNVFSVFSTSYISLTEIISQNPSFDPLELTFATAVLTELGILKKIGGYIVRDKSVKRSIENSKIYQKFLSR